MLLDNGLFFGFVPTGEIDSPNPTRHWIGEPIPDAARMSRDIIGGHGLVYGPRVPLPLTPGGTPTGSHGSPRARPGLDSPW